MKFLTKVWIGDRVQWPAKTLIDTSSATYRILYSLGEGGVGSVYAADIIDVKPESIAGFEARGLQVGSLVAIKQQTLNNEQTWDEVSILSALTGVPEGCAIASCLVDFSIRVATNTAILVIELLDGAQDGLTITEQLQGLPRVAAVRNLRLDILAKLFRAIGTLHELGVYHRDIKPENIVIGQTETFSDQDMLDMWARVAGQAVEVAFEPGMTNIQRYVLLRQNTPGDTDSEAESDFVAVIYNSLAVKLIDFGLATTVSQSQMLDGQANIVGTPRYIDPWLVACGGVLAFYGTPAKNADSRLFETQVWQLTDVWSAGATAYTMFWGEYMFPDTEPEPPLFEPKTLLNSDEKALLTHVLSKLKPAFTDDELPLLSIGLGATSGTSVELFYSILTRIDQETLRSGRIRVSFPGEMYPEDSKAIKPISKLLAIQPRKRKTELLELASLLRQKVPN